MNCKYCDAELPPNGNPHQEYCNHAHRQASYRQRKQPVIPVEVQQELDYLRLRNAQLEAELATLQRQTGKGNTCHRDAAKNTS